MSLEVFEVEEDWSSTCISVRKRCEFDIISITYARFVYWLESMLEVSSGLLDVFWKPLGGVLTIFFVRFWSILGVLWGLLRCPRRVFRSSGVVLEGISHSALDCFWQSHCKN